MGWSVERNSDLHAGDKICGDVGGQRGHNISALQLFFDKVEITTCPAL